MAARACSSSSLKNDFVASQADRFALDYQIFGLGEQGVENERRGSGQLAAAQVLLGDARQQRVGAMKRRTASTRRFRLFSNQARSTSHGCGCGSLTS